MTRGLSDKEKMVLEKRNSGSSLAELAKQMGTNKETIRQIEAKARRKLQGRKESRIMLRLSLEEFNLLTEQSKRLGLTESAYLRMLIYKDAGRKER